MSTSRTLSDERGRDLWKTEKGPGGRTLCRWCRTEVPKGRRTFCGDACVHEWRLRNSPGYVRAKVYERDRGVCRQCGHRGEWQADHILEVVNGGGLCGLENYQTLCTVCHKAKTKELAHQRALKRRQSTQSSPSP